MSERSLVTIALLGYNQDHYIRDAIDGAFSQTYSPLEIIMSDDCSTDRTYEIMKEMAESYVGPHQIRLNRNPVNLGVVGNVNRITYELANGQYVFMAAGDDRSMPDRVERIMDLVSGMSNPPSAFFSAYDEIDHEGAILNHGVYHPSEAYSDLICYIEQYSLHGATMVFSKEVFSRFPPLETFVEDKPLVFRALLLNGLLSINEPLVQVRIVPSLSRRPWDASWLSMMLDSRAASYRQFLLDISLEIKNKRSLIKPGVLLNCQKRIQQLYDQYHYRQAIRDAPFPSSLFRWINSYRLPDIPFREWITDFMFLFPHRLREPYIRLVIRVKAGRNWLRRIFIKNGNR